MFTQILFWLLSALLPLCPVEDANNCYWDASELGNGIGNDWATVANDTIEITIFADGHITISANDQ